MTPTAAREALHRAALNLPDAAVVLVARLLLLGTPGDQDAVLGPPRMVPDNGHAPWDTGVTEEGLPEARRVAAEVWRVLERAGSAGVAVAVRRVVEGGER